MIASPATPARSPRPKSSAVGQASTPARYSVTKQLPVRKKAKSLAGKASPRKAPQARARRQRFRSETRDQMWERLTNPLVSLHEASVLLGLSGATVRRYSDRGLLAHSRTEGGQRRFLLRDVLLLVRQREAQQRLRALRQRRLT